MGVAMRYAYHVVADDRVVEQSPLIGAPPTGAERLEAEVFGNPDRFAAGANVRRQIVFQELKRVVLISSEGDLIDVRRAHVEVHEVDIAQSHE